MYLTTPSRKIASLTQTCHNHTQHLQKKPPGFVNRGAIFRDGVVRYILYPLAVGGCPSISISDQQKTQRLLMNIIIAPGKRLFLSGDEAVARAALEAGVNVATGYPGNPGAKTITALIPIARQYGVRVEWSVNVKVAMEVAAGAAWAG